MEPWNLSGNGGEQSLGLFSNGRDHGSGTLLWVGWVECLWSPAVALGGVAKLGVGIGSLCSGKDRILKS